MRFDLANKEEEVIVYFDSWDEFAAAVQQLCMNLISFALL